ncbi:peptidoglycan-binding protein [Curtobacterium sp. NPDC089689]|uniref:peptidoglycan-binding domain-containing protein n=1 Tax=Curtobacterium sp. NPDC089689 TaxID=3363968 RepID=UPI0037FFCB8A
MADAVIRLPSGTMIGLAAVLVAAVAATVTVVSLPSDRPAVLASASAATSVRVTERADADERQVQLALDTGGPRAVVTARTGTVTASACSVGTVLRSGDVVASVDGEPVIALATDVPLWRDLEPDVRGDDVRGLQRALNVGGAGLAEDGVFGRGTLRAALRFLADRGVRTDIASEQTLPRAPFAWVPSAENTVRSCSAVTGAPVADGGVLAELPAELRSAHVDSLPVEPVAGARDLTIGSTTVPVDEGGVVSSGSSLAAISALPEYAATVASSDGEPMIAATWSLRRPRTVQVVPPTALFAIDGANACVQRTDGRPVRVEVLGSELGQSFVQPRDGTRLDRLRALPDQERPCR